MDRRHLNTLHRRLVRLLLLALVVGFTIAPRASRAQQGQLCFAVPAITNCIKDRFLEYWQQNGGLAVFGYPLTPMVLLLNRDTGQSYWTQYFERNRFELHPENDPPYDILLGRLADELLERQGRSWLSEGQNGENPLGGPCISVEPAPHIGREICGAFLQYWQSHGLNDPRLPAYNRSVQLFGFPLTGVVMETNPNGDRVLTQWFERARFEYHRSTEVLLGLLGNEVYTTRNGAVSPTPPPPAPAPTPTPRPEPLNCTAPLEGGFGVLWRMTAHVRLELGCPLQAPLTGAAAEQTFERGTMYWWGDTRQIYVFAGGLAGRWSQYYDTCCAPGEQLRPITPPPGLFTPQNGFGKLWRNNPDVQQALGWGRAPEVGLTGVYQSFEHGTMLFSPDINGHGQQISVLFEGGGYEIYPEPKALASQAVQVIDSGFYQAWTDLGGVEHGAAIVFANPNPNNAVSAPFRATFLDAGGNVLAVRDDTTAIILPGQRMGRAVDFDISRDARVARMQVTVGPTSIERFDSGRTAVPSAHVTGVGPPPHGFKVFVDVVNDSSYPLSEFRIDAVVIDAAGQIIGGGRGGGTTTLEPGGRIGITLYVKVGGTSESIDHIDLYPHL